MKPKDSENNASTSGAGCAHRRRLGSRQREEELAGVGVLAAVGHGQDPWTLVLQLEAALLVVEFAAVDAVAATAVTCARFTCRIGDG